MIISEIVDSLNALDSIDTSSEFGANSIFWSCLHLLNAYEPTVFTYERIVIDLIEHSKKTYTIKI